MRPSPLAQSLAVAFLLATGVVSARAQAPPERLASLFPKRAEITGEAGGLVRLGLPPEVLTACRNDLSDLRIVDSAGGEIPWMLVGGDPLRRARTLRTVTPEVLEVSRRGDDSATAPPSWHERYVLSAPPEHPADGSWDLVFQIREPSFVRGLTLVGIDGRGNSVELPVAESIFRLAAPLRDRTRVTLPRLELRRLEVTLEGEGDGYLEPAFSYQSARDLPASEKASIPLEIVTTERRGSTTLIDLARPRGLVPDALVVETTTVAFRRTVRVLDRGSGARSEPLGGDTLYRFSDELEDRRLWVTPASGESVRLEVEDEDSPPLAEVRVIAELRLPALIFALPGERGAIGTAELLFGGGRTYFPRYDIAELLPALPATGKAAELATVLRNPERLPHATLGPLTDNPAFDTTPLLAFAMRPGAAVEVGRFSYRRRLHAPESPEGLVRLSLGAADLAVARADLADLRIVDDEDRQLGYLIQNDARRPLVELEVARVSSRDGRSHVELSLPSSPLTVDALELDSPLPFFDREAEIVATLPKTRNRRSATTVLWQGRLVRRVGDDDPLLLSLPERRLENLELRIVDGDDAPLELGRIRARVPLPDLYFAAPAGEYTLLLGDPDVAQPTYEIERARSLVLSVASATAETGEVEKSPRFSAVARWGSGAGAQQLLVWGTLVLAVAAMLALTLRLARREGARDEDGGDGG